MRQNTTDRVSEWLGAYLDGELNAERRAWVEEHLATCAGCREELESLRALSSLLLADAQPATSGAFTSRVMAALPPRASAGALLGLGGSAEALPRKIVLGLYWFPMALFGLWVFLEAVIVASSAALFGMRFLPQGLLPAGAAGSGGALNGWLSGALSMAGLTELAGFVENAAQFWPGVMMLVLELGATALVAVLFLAWLTGFFSFRRAQAETKLSQ